MNILMLILLSLSLSIDSWAVSVSVGICLPRVQLRHALRVAVFFAFFQTLMPAAGWLFGQSLLDVIGHFSHWLAFGLLLLIGGHLIYDTLHEKVLPDDEAKTACPADPLSWRRLSLLGLATSIDAMAAGLSLSATETAIVPALALIGGTTLTIAFSGMLIGRRLGVFFQRRACVAGGVILMLIGVRILIDGLSV
ncbi:MAG: manganese efflux pump MntP family protein [Eubacteriales bacterium]|nr:manganese efflux pump MntP family protein [Eubacteriales bacterium]